MPDILILYPVHCGLFSPSVEPIFTIYPLTYRAESNYFSVILITFCLLIILMIVADTDRRDERPMEGDSGSESLRQSGIASRLGGHPRGVIQFLPSAKQTQFFPVTDSYNTYSKNKTTPDKKALFRRKTSLPETYLTYDQVRYQFTI